MNSAGWADIFVARFSAGGSYQWGQRFGGATNSDVGYSIAVSNQGDIVATGSFDGSVNFGGGLLNSAGSTDIFMAKFSGSGNHLWSRRFGNSGGDTGYGVDIDVTTGNSAITGYFSTSANFGGGTLNSAGSIDTFLADFGP